jgi:hypothetical protein
MKTLAWMCALAACGSSSNNKMIDAPGGGSGDGPGNNGDAPVVGACALFPADNIFNTPIDSLPVDPNSAAYITSIGGSTHLHLDLGQQTDQTQADFYGIPYNVVHGNALTWTQVAFYSSDPSLSWDAAGEADCADGSHAFVSPCTISAPMLPIPASPIVEGGINSAADEMPYGDHHLVVLDADTCRLWETYHSYSPAAGTWNIYGAAGWDLRSNAWRPADWTSADAAGFPILPLLLRADEASSGTIAHAIRFTVNTSRTTYVWPARHEAGSTGSTNAPPMGQLFRLKSTFQIPSSYNVQSKAILQAMKTYGIYIADNGSDWYITGEPSANWMDNTFSEVQSVTGMNFEAVDITAITSRAGFDAATGKVP